MKKWISLLTSAACIFSSVHADPAISPATETMAVSPELSDDTAPPPEGTDRKPVGQAATDGSKTAGSGAGKYVLAACAIAIGITALILVARHGGHHKKHHHHSP
jgi:hypothetical protein